MLLLGSLAMADRHKDPAASVCLGKGKIRIFCHALQQDGHHAVLSRNGHTDMQTPAAVQHQLHLQGPAAQPGGQLELCCPWAVLCPHSESFGQGGGCGGPPEAALVHSKVWAQQDWDGSMTCHGGRVLMCFRAHGLLATCTCSFLFPPK